MKNIALILILTICSCKQNQQKGNTENKLVKEYYLDKSIDSTSNSLDSLNVNSFIKNIINEVNSQEGDKIASKFHYPISIFEFRFNSKQEFIEQWESDGRLRSYLNLDIYDENDVFKGRSTFKSTNIIYNKDILNNPTKAQFGLGAGLIFDLEKNNNSIKIVRIDVAG